MVEWNAKPCGRYPESLGECFEQGKRDFLAGYKITWTPNLGPMSLHFKAMERWRDGWLLQRDEVIEHWMKEAGREQGRTEDPEGDSEGE